MKVIRRAVKVTFELGDFIITEINGTKKQIENYYFNNQFNIDNDRLQKAVKVEFLK